MQYSVGIDMDDVIVNIKEMAFRMREHALSMAFSSGNNGAHLGGGLSIIEILATLYGGILRIDPNDPQWEDRDRFILSKGHGVLAYYSALAESGFFPVDNLKKFEVNGEFLPGHPVLNINKGIECSSGSLGMGLSFGVGIALAGRLKNKSYNTFVLMGDGECDEGSVWEAAMSASHFHLSYLFAIIDSNSLQYDGYCSEIMSQGSFSEKWESFGWRVTEVDGHDVQALFRVFTDCIKNPHENPHVILAHTIKGKGVSFMEGKKEWHHGSLSREQYESACEEIRRSQ